jgi:glycosyltransferase involved in cell wall biosynthesis
LPKSSGIRVLLEMRPALDGYSGIPQETRLLFRGLSLLEDVSVQGLLQHTQRVLPPGISEAEHRRQNAASKNKQLSRLGRIIITFEQSYWDSVPRVYAYTFAMAFWHLIGGRQRLTRFDPEHFRDYIWRRLFAKSLPPSDYDLVTGGEFRIAREPWNAMQICAFVTRAGGWPSLFPRLNTKDFDFVIVETPYPASMSKSTQLIVRYHDAIPLTMPHTISDKRWHHAFHYHALKRNVDDGAWFVCVSEATRNDLVAAFPQVESRSSTIHNIVSDDYFNEPSNPGRIPQIIRTRLNANIKPPLEPQFTRRLFDEGAWDGKLEYLLMVSTVEPRKNHETLLAAWEKLRVEGFPDLKLLIVGKLGWNHGPIVAKIRPWLERGDAFLIEGVPSSDLRLLYKHASATVCPSFGEGFDFAGVEAMRSGGAVVASDIPVHREVYADAAEYFNAYDVDDLRRAVAAVIASGHSARRELLIANGAELAERYSYDVILPQWEAFLKGLRT